MQKLEDTQIILLAGGKGTRLIEHTKDYIPKPMVLINGKPALQHLIEMCLEQGFRNFLILLNHKAEKIINFFGTGEKFNANIDYQIEDSPRGTAGALFDSMDKLSERFIVIYADTYINVNLKKFLKYHVDNKTKASIFVHPNNHPYDSDLVQVDKNNLVVNLYSPTDRPKNPIRNLVNAALYVLEKSIFNGVILENGVIDIARDLFPKILNNGIKISAYISPEYIKDFGTIDRLSQVKKDIKKYLPEKLSDSYPRKAIFIDRDGTLIEDVGHLSDINEIRLFRNSGKALNQINNSGILGICVTNQPVIARGELTIDGLKDIHAQLELMLSMEKGYLNDIFYCPHYPESGFKGEVRSLKINCECRKPNIGMIKEASRIYSINLQKSWIIGDSCNDMLAGNRAGLKKILVLTGETTERLKLKCCPDFTFSSFYYATNWILFKYYKISKILKKFQESFFGIKDVIIIGPAIMSMNICGVFSEIITELGIRKELKIINKHKSENNFGCYQGMDNTSRKAVNWRTKKIFLFEKSPAQVSKNLIKINIVIQKNITKTPYLIKKDPISFTLFV